MAFGFPAYHRQNYQFDPSTPDPRQAVRSALQSLKWSIASDTPETIIASSSVNLLSWGEKIQIDFVDASTISVTSKCAMPTQCVDWGRNKDNVTSLLNTIQWSGGQSPPPLPPGQAAAE